MVYKVTKPKKEQDVNPPKAYRRGAQGHEALEGAACQHPPKAYRCGAQGHQARAGCQPPQNLPLIIDSGLGLTKAGYIAHGWACSRLRREREQRH